MGDKGVKLFENKRVRTAWDEEKQDWLFSIIDVIGILTDNNYQAARNYWKVLKLRLKEEGNQTVTNCNQLKMLAEDGKMRQTDVADTEQLLRLIQSIPSHRAEPFKVWLASVGKDRINETFDPELAIDRALVTYLRKGYSKDWIHQRLQAIQVRKELTDEWGERGVEGNEYAVLTDEITKAWANLTTRQYKNLKGLTKENLRDNMSMLELTLNQLAEVTTTELSKEQKPQTFEENRQMARSGGEVAGNARKDIEKRTGKPAITNKKAIDFSRLLTEDITNTENKPNTKKEEE